jgi:hypothetical protein
MDDQIPYQPPAPPSKDDWEIKVSVEGIQKAIEWWKNRNKKDEYVYVYECGCIAREGPKSEHYCPDHPWRAIQRLKIW